MGINRILEGLSGVGNSNHEPSLPKPTPTFAPIASEVGTSSRRAEHQLYGSYQRSKIEALWTQRQPTSQAQQSQPKPGLVSTPTPKPSATAQLQKTQQTQRTQQAQNAQAARNNGEFKPVTAEQVKTIMLLHVRESERAKFEQNLEEKTKRLNEAMQEFGINKPLAQAMFLTTISHESRGTMALYEERSKHKSSKSIWKGSGDMQLTGPRNYLKASNYFKVGNLIEKKNKRGHVIQRRWDGFVKDDNARAMTNAPEWSSRIAGWFWTKGSVTSKQMGDKPADDLLDFRHAFSAVNSGRPNGPINNWDDRVRTYRRALEAFKIEVSPQLERTIEGQQKIKTLPSEGRVHRTHNSQRK